MSYVDVTEVVGPYGNEEANSDVEGIYLVPFLHGNGPVGANANVTFGNGHVIIAKAQAGLQYKEL